MEPPGLRAFLDEFEQAPPAVAGGVAAATTIGLSAALVGKLARADGARALAAQAAALRERASRLAAADADAYAAALELLERARPDPPPGSPPLAPSLLRAVDVLIALAETAFDVVTVADGLAHRGDPAVRADAVAAASLAAAGGRAVAHLVEVNLAMHKDDDRVDLARRLAVAGGEAVTRLVAREDTAATT